MAIAPRASTIEALVVRNGGEYLCAACESNLHGGIAYSAYAGMNENGLSGVYLCAIDEAFHAVIVTSGIAADCRMVSVFGLCASSAASATMNSASVPCKPATPPTMPKTSSPE